MESKCEGPHDIRIQWELLTTGHYNRYENKLPSVNSLWVTNYEVGEFNLQFCN